MSCPPVAGTPSATHSGAEIGIILLAAALLALLAERDLVFGLDLAPDLERERRLVEWEKAPSARYCHPREEHLLPLHVCQGMADMPAKLIFDDQILGKRSVAFLW